jgi:hypothetical protein
MYISTNSKQIQHLPERTANAGAIGESTIVCNSNGSNETKVTSSATVGTPQKIEPIRAPSFSVS